MTYVIDAENVTVQYRVDHFRSSTFKEWILNRFRKGAGSELFTALDKVTLKVKRGESVALVGHNGCGKSTLLRVIAGILPPGPDAKIAVVGRIAPMIELGAGFDGELSGRENIYLSCLLMGMAREEIDESIEDIIDFAEIRAFIDTPVKRYSSGMYARLGFACATAVHPDVLIVDEVLAVGDTNFAAKCLFRIGELRKTGVTVLLVSHDEGVVRRFCDRVVVMEKGRVMFDGNVDEAFTLQKEIMDERARAVTPESTRRKSKRAELLEREEYNKTFNRKPTFHLNAEVMQDGAPVPKVDLTREFSVEVKMAVIEPELFDGDIFFGVEWRTSEGVRISGFGSEPQILIPVEVAQRSPNMVVRFELPKGIPQLCGGRYWLWFAINDQNMRRNLVYGQLFEMEMTNPAQGTNEHADILHLANNNPKVILTRDDSV